MGATVNDFLIHHYEGLEDRFQELPVKESVVTAVESLTGTSESFHKLMKSFLETWLTRKRLRIHQPSLGNVS